jgi:hypothetical protein
VFVEETADDFLVNRMELSDNKAARQQHLVESNCLTPFCDNLKKKLLRGLGFWECEYYNLLDLTGSLGNNGYSAGLTVRQSRLKYPVDKHKEGFTPTRLGIVTVQDDPNATETPY